mgnify:CR=1 FL=1|tara:strand:- start:597 stop:1031 length:435 start_codon:yes stop_codon:yes gene_type:complete
MKKKQKPLSFSLNPDNIAYIESAVLKQKETNHRYSRSMYMDDLITHLRTKAVNKVVVKKEVRAASKRFTPPTVEEVFHYCNERCNNVDAQNFVDHYSSNGWMRGKAKIKDWKACVRTWEKNSTSSSNQLSKTTEQNIKNLEGEW